MSKCISNTTNIITNEEIALLIQQGNKNYIPLLWERIKPLMIFILGKRYITIRCLITYHLKI